MPSTSADEGKKALWSHPVCPFPQFPLNTFDTPGLILWFAELYLRNNNKKSCDDFKVLPTVKYSTSGVGCRAFDLRASPALCS